MVNVTELNRGPDISANEIDAALVSAEEQLNVPHYATRDDAPDERTLFTVDDDSDAGDGSGDFAVIWREIA